jgi:hypothetical protein
MAAITKSAVIAISASAAGPGYIQADAYANSTIVIADTCGNSDAANDASAVSTKAAASTKAASSAAAYGIATASDIRAD